ncbi:MAG TPA: tetratricopeptide repeat-containing diguanylate cyclase [Acidobacteriota bacterium]
MSRGEEIRISFLLILTAALVLSASPGQTNGQANLAALQKELETLPDQDKPPVLLEIASALREKSPREALSSALEALRLAQDHNRAWDAIQARMIAGEANLRLKRYDKSEDLLDLNQIALKALLSTPLAYFREKKLFEALFQNSRLAADCHQAAKKYKEALLYCLEALVYQKKVAKPGPSGPLLYQAGLASFFLADYQKALPYALDGLSQAERAGAAGQTALALHLLGAIHLKLNRMPEALDYFYRALDIAVQENNKSQACLSLNEIGHVLSIQKNFREALTFQQKALEAARQTNNPDHIANVLYDFGFTYLEMNRPEEALPLLRESVERDKTSDRTREIVAAISRLASADMEKKNHRHALRLFMDYLPLAEKAKLHQEMLDIYLKLADIYMRLGGPEISIGYLQKAYVLRDIMHEEEMVRLTREIQARYETDKRQKENDILKRELRIKALDISQKGLQISFLLALSALVLLFVLILYNRYRFRLKAHQELEQANRQIQEKQVQLTGANRRLDEMTREDPLTGLANRRELLGRFEQEKVRFLRSGRAFSLIMADLDGFKVVNDTYGHNCGDDILKTLASLLRSMIRGQDIVGRWGGDEFLILLPETGLRGGEAVAKKVRARVRRTSFQWKENKLKVQLSLGVSIYKKGMEFDDCLKNADLAMFRRKRKGKTAVRPA